MQVLYAKNTLASGIKCACGCTGTYNVQELNNLDGDPWEWWTCAACMELPVKDVFYSGHAPGGEGVLVKARCGMAGMVNYAVLDGY